MSRVSGIGWEADDSMNVKTDRYHLNHSINPYIYIIAKFHANYKTCTVSVFLIDFR